MWKNAPATVWGSVFQYLGGDLMKIALGVPPIYDLTMDPDVTAMIDGPRERYRYKDNWVLTWLRPRTELFVFVVPPRYTTVFGSMTQLIGVLVERIERDLSLVFKRAAGFVPAKFNRPEQGGEWYDIQAHYKEEALRVWWEHFAQKHEMENYPITFRAIWNSVLLVYNKDEICMNYIPDFFAWLFKGGDPELVREWGAEFQRVALRLLKVLR